MCFASDWQKNLRMRVTNWPNICVDHFQFSIQTISAAHIKGKMSNLPIDKLIILIKPFSHVCFYYENEKAKD
jgi:hypothetical protein